MKQRDIFAIMFLADFLAIFITCANLRAVAQGSYFWTILTEPTLSLGCFCIAKVMMDREEWRTWIAGVGGALGATAGSLLSIYLTKMFYH